MMGFPERIDRSTLTLLAAPRRAWACDLKATPLAYVVVTEI